MLEMFYPRRYEVSTYVIPFDYYHAQGMQGVIFDIDNTWCPMTRRQTDRQWDSLSGFAPWE